MNAKPVMGRLLVLEDDTDVAEVLDMIFALDGHETRSTDDGREALLMAAREAWDLVVLDVDVRELSGLAVARAIGDFSSTPTLVLSAATGDWQRQAFAAGALACVQKPFDMDELRALVRTLIEEPLRAQETRVERLSDADLKRVCALTPQRLDELPYGVIRVDSDGAIVAFNAYESAASGLSRPEVVGRPFAEVAPCSRVKQFAGAIAEGVRAGKLDRVLRFVFPTHRALSVVSVRLYLDPEWQSVWIFVSRRAPSRADRTASSDEASARAVDAQHTRTP
jgi:photoactive yellow protein